jgi:hypothetical protein
MRALFDGGFLAVALTLIVNPADLDLVARSATLELE